MQILKCSGAVVLPVALMQREVIMKRFVKQNLIPDEVRDKYLRKYPVCFVSAVCMFLIISIAVQYISIGIIKGSTEKMQRENDEYRTQQKIIKELDAEIELYKKTVNEYEAAKFPFSEFLFDLEALKPASVQLISVDSPDRLINEGDNAKNDKKSDDSNKSDKKSDAEEKTSEEKNGEKSNTPKIGYEKDLSRQKIVIRGYGSSQKAISDYLHTVSELTYITKLDVIAIERHRIENGVYNIFEATVEGWGYNEAQVS